jgi:hypothetical protein
MRYSKPLNYVLCVVESNTVYKELELKVRNKLYMEN